MEVPWPISTFVHKSFCNGFYEKYCLGLSLLNLRLEKPNILWRYEKMSNGKIPKNIHPNTKQPPTQRYKHFDERIGAKLDGISEGAHYL